MVSGVSSTKREEIACPLAKGAAYLSVAAILGGLIGESDHSPFSTRVEIRSVYWWRNGVRVSFEFPLPGALHYQTALRSGSRA